MPRRLRAALAMVFTWSAASALLTVLLGLAATLLTHPLELEFHLMALIAGTVFGGMSGALAGASVSGIIALFASRQEIDQVHRWQETLVFFLIGAVSGVFCVAGLSYFLTGMEYMGMPGTYLVPGAIYGVMSTVVGTGVLSAARRAALPQSHDERLKAITGA